MERAKGYPIQLVMILKSSRIAERIAQALTIVSFVLLCWVAHRVLDTRTACVNSSFISFVQINGKRVANCLFESRLSPRSLIAPLSEKKRDIVRSLEVLEPLAQLLRGQKQGLAVDVTEREPHLFELGKGYVRIGVNWLKDPAQLRRALVMGVLRNEFPQTYTNQFQLETIADFILLSVFAQDEWTGDDGKIYSLMRDMRFSTTAPSFEQYCMSPFRSLSHRSVCHLDGNNSDMDQVNVWGFRPLLAVSMWRVFSKLSLSEQIHVMGVLRTGKALPVVHDLQNTSANGLVEWFKVTLHEHLDVLLPKSTEATEYAVKRTLKELEVEAPTHWELTMDLTSTPVWREIMEQLRQRAQLRKKERVLVFTPEGAKALPSGLPVAWAGDEISSQKHVLIACNWPAPEDTVHVKARRLFAQQSCGKLTRSFWD